MYRRPTRRHEWERIVESFVAAEFSESDGLEFKSQIDWGNNSHIGAIARAVIAFANRDPKSAAAKFDGRGLIVIGLEPGRAIGVEEIDPADLENKLAPYLGLSADDPQWDQHWITHDDVKVVIIDVAAPEYGDPIYVLHRSAGDYRQGQVFVRIGAKTIPATPQELDRLAHRRAGKIDDTLDIEVSIASEVPIRPYMWNAADIVAFIESERSDLLGSLGEYAGVQYSDVIPPESHPAGHSLFSMRPEERTPRAFRAQVESYLEDLHQSIPAILTEIAPFFVPAPTFVLSNLSRRNYKSVEIVLKVEGEARAERVSDFPSEYDLSMRRLLQKRPRKFGPFSGVDSIAESIAKVGQSPAVGYVPLTSIGLPEPIIQNGGSFSIRFPAIDLRPEEKFVELSSDIAVLLPAARDLPVVATWVATATNVDAVAESQFPLPVQEPALDLFALWRAT